MNRRSFLSRALAASLVLAAACKSKDERCAHCGMRIDHASPWRAELLTTDGKTISFDTPRCALIELRSGKLNAKGLRVQEYYDRTMRDAEGVRFLVGGDVVGPMGPDFVPVDPSRASKFIQDHRAERALRLDEITLAMLTSD